jgi:hypothetical protein
MDGYGNIEKERMAGFRLVQMVRFVRSKRPETLL